MIDLSHENKDIVLFDGCCHLCSSAIRFIIKHERNQKLLFASLQSSTGVRLLKQFNVDTQKTDSIVLIKNNQSYIKSSAALHISKYLKGLYPILYGFIIIPSFIRNWVYDYIARNRYKWFGKIEYCEIPDENMTQRFI